MSGRCEYCSARIVIKDRTCAQCGAPNRLVDPITGLAVWIPICKQALDDMLTVTRWANLERAKRQLGE